MRTRGEGGWSMKQLYLTALNALKIYLLGMLLTYSSLAYGQSVVTTYVIKTQEEREKTRWTLTEWLRIKERMRLMDVWLAMFSSPQKSEFKPEFQVSYSLFGGQGDTYSSSGNGVETLVRGRRIEGQLWLTNLFSGVFGMRTLNIDLGLFAGDRRRLIETNNDHSSDQTAITEAISQSSWRVGSLSDQYYSMATLYGGSLRLFGKHIQDTSLVGKYGVADITSRTHLLAAPAGDASVNMNGRMWGAELRIYLFKYLGLQGTYEQIDAKTDGLALTDHFYLGQVFVDVSLFRLGFGYFGSGHKMDVSTAGASGAYGGSEKGLQLLTGLSF